MKFVFAVFAGILLLKSSTSVAQNSRFAGRWEGSLNIGVDLKIVFNIKQDNDHGLFSTADSPDQGAFGIKCDTTYSSGDSITIEIYNLKATFSAVLRNDTTLTGSFTQGGPYPLTLNKREKGVERNRPQTPQPPFPYSSEDVTYSNPDQSLQFGATITIPDGKGPFPAIMMITGSGPQNRDEELFGHKPFAVIADYLSRKGFIVLRADDRGIAKSTGNFGAATSADFANDVSAGVDYLLTRPEADKKKIGLIGHSEGGMIAPMVQTKRKDIAFMILLAGPGVKITDLMAEQNAAILRSENVSDKAVNAYIPLYKKIDETIIHSTDSVKAVKDVRTLVDEWAQKTDPDLRKQLGLDDPSAHEIIAEKTVHSLFSPWFRYFLSFDPVPYLSKSTGKVLALNGDKDIQVISKQNLPGIEAALKKSGVTEYEVVEIPGLNHLFQFCTKCTTTEYGELEETFSPKALRIMSDWLEKNIK